MRDVRRTVDDNVGLPGQLFDHIEILCPADGACYPGVFGSEAVSFFLASDQGSHFHIVVRKLSKERIQDRPSNMAGRAKTMLLRVRMVLPLLVET